MHTEFVRLEEGIVLVEIRSDGLHDFLSIGLDNRLHQ